MTERVTIAIDGPAGAGKTTLGKVLAKKTGKLYIDTGIMYRAVAFLALRQKRDVGQESTIVELAESLVFKLDEHEADGVVLTVNGEDITDQLDTPEVDAIVSTVARYPAVRKAMVTQQRELAHAGNIIMVGRDIGTVVLPDASIKLFLTATTEERARRRWLEYQQTVQTNGETYEGILSSMKKRDEIDSLRDVSPLRPADDALIIDSSSMTIEEVLDLAINAINALQQDHQET